MFESVQAQLRPSIEPIQRSSDMATIEIHDLPLRRSRGQFHLLATMSRLWAGIRETVADRRTLHELYQLDPHLLRDIGFDPAKVYSAYEGAIGEVRADATREL
jgi:uncharacterized protein YjiS (DUF1127 family)